MKESNCCGAKLYHPDIAMCTDCGEHCDVVDNKETWQNRFDSTIIVSEQMNKDIKQFFQSELDRIVGKVEEYFGNTNDELQTIDFKKMVCEIEDYIIDIIK